MSPPPIHSNINDSYISVEAAGLPHSVWIWLQLARMAFRASSLPSTISTDDLLHEIGVCVVGVGARVAEEPKRPVFSD